MITPREELTAQFLAILTEQGFNVYSIAPYLKTIIYDEFANEVEAPTEEGSIRFEIHYPEMLPICQYCGWVAGRLETRDEWFLPGDKIFYYDRRETLNSFLAAFKYAAALAMLTRLDIPTDKAPWHLEGWTPPARQEKESPDTIGTERLQQKVANLHKAANAIAGQIMEEQGMGAEFDKDGYIEVSLHKEQVEEFISVILNWDQ